MLFTRALRLRGVRLREAEDDTSKIVGAEGIRARRDEIRALRQEIRTLRGNTTGSQPESSADQNA